MEAKGAGAWDQSSDCRRVGTEGMVGMKSIGVKCIGTVSRQLGCDLVKCRDKY